MRGSQTEKSMTSDIKVRTLLLLIGLTLVSLAVTGVTAAGLEEVGVLANGPSFDLVESNGYLYAGQGSEVVTYDVSSSAKMSALTWKSGLSRLLVGGPVRGICADAGYLYIAAENRFVIADISNPASPKLVSTLNSGGTDVLIKGTYVYLLSPGAGIRVIDVSNRTAPRIVKTVYLAGKNKPRRGTINGNYMFVGMETDNRLDIIDISTPQNSKVVGSHKVNGTATISGVAVKNGYAFITEYHNGVRVIDVKNPAKTMEVTRLLGIDANDIKIQANYAYVSVRYQGFSIINISDPQNIRIVGQSNAIKGYIEGIYVTPTNTFLSADTMGFGIFNTSNVTAPRLLSQVAVIGFPEGITVRDNWLYIGAHNDGVWIVDISNPAIPKETAYINSGGRNREVSLQGNNLYVAGEWQRLYVLNVSDPKKPRITLSHFGDNIGTVLADGKYVYTSLGIVDFTTPSSPVYVARAPYFDGKFAKYKSNYLLIAGNGIRIIDVSDKKNPVIVGHYGNGTTFKDVAVNGNVAVGLTGNSIVAVDISNIASPKKLSQLDYPGHWVGYAVAMNGTMVYAAGSGSENIKAFDVSNPSAMKLVGSIGLYGDFWSIAYDKGYIYAAEKMSLHILSSSFVPSTPVTPVTTPTVTPVTTTPAIKVTVPDGGETWQRGSTHTVSWDYTGSPGSTVKIVLMKGGVEVGTIKDRWSVGSSGKGSYTWSIYPSGTTGSDFKVSVQSISQPTIKDTSDNYLAIVSGTTGT